MVTGVLSAPIETRSSVEPAVHTEESTRSDVLRGRDILCFSHDWNGDPLSKTHLMRLLARDNRVLWVNSIGYRAPRASKADLRRAFAKLAAATQPVREVEKNLFVLNPLVIPAYGLPGMRTINRHWLRRQVRGAMRRLGFRRPLNWVFNPAAGIIAGTLGEERVIYYCVDEYTVFAGVATEALAKVEDQLLRRADLVIVSAEPLLKTKIKVNPNTALVRHGVNFEHFRKALDPATPIPDVVANLPRPILGFFGLISEDWVDVDLLEALAKRFPAASVVLLGKVAMDLSKLARLPNVHILGRQPYESLPAFSKAFDVGLLPFLRSEVTLHCNPLKAREYLAAGLPVVSTRIPEVEALGGCHIADTTEDFLREVEAALTDPTPRETRSELMRNETWDARLDEIRGHLAKLAPPKSPERRAEPAPSLPKLIAGDFKAKAEFCYGNGDSRSIVRALLADGSISMILYRLMQWSRRHRLGVLEMIFNKLNAALCHCIIGRGAEFGPGMVFLHSNGLVINGQVRAGSHIRLEHQVTIGAEKREIPRIGDNVFIGAGAKILGPVTVGDGARVGANAVVVHDVPPYSTVVGVPARVVRTGATPTDVTTAERTLAAS